MPKNSKSILLLAAFNFIIPLLLIYSYNYYGKPIVIFGIELKMLSDQSKEPNQDTKKSLQINKELKYKHNLKIPNFKNDSIKQKNEILNNLKSILIPKKNNIEEITNPLNIKPTSIKSPKIYVVKRGDTIYRIAQKFQVSGKKILLINNLKENSIIRPGQKIKLP